MSDQAASPHATPTEPDQDGTWRDWIDQFDEPAALLRPFPWCFTANSTLDALLANAPRDASSLATAFSAGGGSGNGEPGKELAALFAAGRPFGGRVSLGHTASPGTPLLLHADFAPLPDSDGLWLCTCVELSAMERSVDQRTTTLKHLQHTLNQLSDPISLVDTTETLLFANDAYAQFHGYVAEPCVGRTLRQVMDAQNYAWTTPHRERLFRTLQPVGYQSQAFDNLKNGRVMDVYLRPIPGGRGQPTKMATLGRDVTLRHRGMEALRQTLERLDTLFEAGIEGILLCEDDRIVDANPIACHLLGLEPEQLIGQPALQALQRLGLPEEIHTPQQLALSLLPSDGGRKPPLQIQSIHFLDEEQPCHAVLLQDMSYRYQAQQRIDRLLSDLRWQTSRAEAADRGKSIFLASASHDLRQPIHALGLFLTTIQSLNASAAPPPGEALLPVVQRMRSSLDGLMELLDMLLGASLVDVERQRPTLRPMPLQPLLLDLYSDFAAVANQKQLQLRVLPSRAWVLSDPTVLRRILNNLLTNALRYTREGRVVLGVRSRGTHVDVQVWDTGVGIAPEQLDAIFREFYRIDLRPLAGERSEGLGLSIVRRAAGELGARLDVRSLPGRGSMFSVLLPRCAPRHAEAPGSEAADPQARAPGRQVLLIDDDAMVLLATAQLLKTWGHEVLSAANADVAMRLFEANAHRIDTVICDYMVDPSINGVQLLLRLRERHPKPLAMCLVTGDISAELLEQAPRHGFTLLHKPVNADELERFLSGAG